MRPEDTSKSSAAKLFIFLTKIVPTDQQPTKRCVDASKPVYISVRCDNEPMQRTNLEIAEPYFAVTALSDAIGQGDLTRHGSLNQQRQS